MAESDLQAIAASMGDRFGDAVSAGVSAIGELTLELQDPSRLKEVSLSLRDDEKFEVLIDVAGVDYLGFGADEWKTQVATDSGFSRAVSPEGGVIDKDAPGRLAVVYHLLSISRNERARLRVRCPDTAMPLVDSVVDVWPSANWFEREAFDLFGILFQGHPDLRRLLTDYGFIGHPFRKDFPLIGNVEVRYDPEKGRVVYEPVSIEPRTLVPRVIRDDNRYSGELTDRPSGADTDA